MELTFTKKKCSSEFNMSDGNYNFPLEKPMWCPWCNAFQDGIALDRRLFAPNNNFRPGVVYYRCTHCQKTYLVIYNVSFEEKVAKLGTLYPTKEYVYENELLAPISPRFIASYNQAYRCEQRGDIELAAIGYRQALECLVKDYAVNVLEKPRDEVIKQSLFNAIEQYLTQKDLVSTADVVRILGNDYAHYERKYPEHDFSLLKRYLTIFINLVETKVMIAQPPVSRPLSR